jgi:transglutaminase-like putative cysteine protease
MKLSLTHSIRYSLGTPLRAVEHLLLTPVSTPQQKIESWSITGPGLDGAATFRDGYGNRAHLVTLMRPEAEIEITITGRVETFDKSGVLGRLDYDPSPALFRRRTTEAEFDAALLDGLSLESGRVALLHALMDRVHSTNHQSAQSQSLDGRTQTQSSESDVADKTHAFIGAARTFDIPARYVTGYVLDDGDARVHAWAEAWDEGLGWIAFDPALNFCPAASHIRVASGLDASSTPPIRSVPALPEAASETLVIDADQEPST